MKANRAALARAVDSVVDDTADLDWGLMTVELDDVRDRELLRHIRLLSQISEIQKAQPGAADEAQLRARAHALVLRMPVEAPTAAGDASTASADLQDAQTVLQWGRLELRERVGKGTFGDVFRAHDEHLERDVAVKLLHGGGSRRALVARLLQEARALARVHHPNVVVIHDAEERDGRAGLCMEFIRGKTLAQILAAEGPRGAGEAALIGQDVCRALAAVHAAGLLHRDIKAQNVMREDGGRVVLMDFGAGLPATEESARAGSITGTPLYLAPEVLEHGKASARSDVYSVGVLLFHLVTNEFPVRGQTPAEILEAHRAGKTMRLGDVAPALDSWFVRVVERATAPDPKDRHATPGELEAALARRRSPFTFWPIVTAAALTLAMALGVQQWRNPGPAVGSGPMLAVLPLEAGIGVDPPLAVAITDEIYQGLAMIDGASVISSFSSAKAKRDQSTIPAIAKVLEASAVIDGMVSEVDGQLEVKLRVFDAGRDSPRWAGIVSAPRASPGTLRRDGAMSIARALNIALSARALRRLTRPAAVNSQAYDAYARGLDLQARGTRGELERARDELETSIRLDPGYAPAHAALARVRLDLGANGRRSEWAAEGQLARLAASRALEIEPQLAEAHVALGQVAFLLDWDWAAAERAFQRALSIASSDDGARLRYAQLLNARGRVDDALEELETARRLDPLSESLDGVVASTLQYARRFGEAEALLVSVRGLTPNPSMVHNQLGRIFAATGRFDRAIAEFEQLDDSATGDAYVQGEIGAALAGAGRTAEARQMLDRLLARAATEEISPEVFSLIETRLGRTGEAMDHLELAVAQRARRVIWVKVDPRWDPLRGDPRFTVLVSRLGL